MAMEHLDWNLAFLGKEPNVQVPYGMTNGKLLSLQQMGLLPLHLSRSLILLHAIS